MYSPPYHLFSVFKTTHNYPTVVPMLKHGHIRNQHTQIIEKKTKKKPWTPTFSSSKNKKFFQKQNRNSLFNCTSLDSVAAQIHKETDRRTRKL